MQWKHYSPQKIGQTLDAPWQREIFLAQLAHRTLNTNNIFHQGKGEKKE